MDEYYWEMIFLPTPIISDDSLGKSTFSRMMSAEFNATFNCILMLNNNLTISHGGIDHTYTKIIEKIDKVKFLQV
jgi:hypothetical protein